MKSLNIALVVLLGLLATVEHVGLLLWGVVWPLRHLAQYPDDGGVNLFSIEASLLFLAMSVGAAFVVYRVARGRLTLAAMALGLPCGLFVTFSLMRLLFLDPVVAYLTLLPGLAAVAAPYGLVWLLARRRSVDADGPEDLAVRAR